MKTDDKGQQYERAAESAMDIYVCPDDYDAVRITRPGASRAEIDMTRPGVSRAEIEMTRPGVSRAEIKMTRPDLRALLQDAFGFSDFRPSQEMVCQAVAD